MWETQEIIIRVPDYKVNEIDKWAVVAELNKDGKSVAEVREEFVNEAIALLITCLDMSVEGYKICGINATSTDAKGWRESPHPNRSAMSYEISCRTQPFGDIVWTDMDVLANARRRRDND